MNRVYILLCLFLLAQKLLPAAGPALPVAQPFDLIQDLINKGYRQEIPFEHAGRQIVPWVRHIRCLDGQIDLKTEFVDEEETITKGRVWGLITPAEHKASLKEIESFVPHQKYGTAIVRWFLRKCADYQASQIGLEVIPFGQNQLSEEDTVTFYKKNGAVVTSDSGLVRMGIAVAPSPIQQPDEQLWRAATTGSMHEFVQALNYRQSSNALMTALAKAAVAGHWHIVDFLRHHSLSLDTPVYAVNRVGAAEVMPLIMHATREKKELLVKAFLDHKASVDARDSWGRTALYLAVKSAQSNLINVLIAHKADVNARTNQDEPILHAALARSQYSASGQPPLDMVQRLIDAKANVNLPGQRQWTALHHAALLDFPIAMLLAAKADPMMRDQQGNVASSYSSGKNRQLLQKAMGAAL